MAQLHRPTLSCKSSARVACSHDAQRRVSMLSRDGVPASIKQGTVVNMDILAGVAVLDPALAVVVQG